MAAPIEDDYDYDDDGEFVPPTEEELKRLEERRKKSDQVSAELGRRMLQGWGLMGVHCPQEDCFAPLMREPKTAKLFCVNCNMYVITEAEYEASKSAAATASSNASQTAGTSTVESHKPVHEVPTISAATSTSTTGTSSSVPLSGSSFAPQTAPTSSATHQKVNSAHSTEKEIPSTTNTGGPSTISIPPAAMSMESQPGPAIKKALNLLTVQMELTNSRLQTTASSFEESLQILGWYEQCAQTMMTLKRAGHEFGAW
jgi:uncharacterized Zn finger protein (UPF0148 family)